MPWKPTQRQLLSYSNTCQGRFTQRKERNPWTNQKRQESQKEPQPHPAHPQRQLQTAKQKKKKKKQQENKTSASLKAAIHLVPPRNTETKTKFV